MKKGTLALPLLLLCCGLVFPQTGAEELVQQAADQLRAFFMNKANARVAIVQFENDSELSDLAMQKIYQMLTARLEADPNIKMADLLVNFTKGRGEFNLSQVQGLDYLLAVRFIQNKTRTGLGLTLFSRWQDKLVWLKYLEKNLSRGEMDLLNARSFAFAELGFSRLTEFETRNNLLDVQNIAGADGQSEYFFYYPDEIVIYLARGERLEKQSVVKLTWTRPYYPVLIPQGKLLAFSANGNPVLTAGANFSSYAQVLTRRDNQWLETAKIGFIPFKQLSFNGNPYLVGARYEEGKNYFRDKLFFMPFNDPVQAAASVEKKIYPAYAIDFSIRDGQLQGVHLIDRDYRYHLLNSDLAEATPEADRRGASLAASDDQWLAVSDYSRATDRIFFYDISSGGQRPVYTAKIDGEVQFISAGVWGTVKGFWVCSRLTGDDGDFGRSVLQFWGKRHE